MSNNCTKSWVIHMSFVDYNFSANRNHASVIRFSESPWKIEAIYIYSKVKIHYICNDLWPNESAILKVTLFDGTSRHACRISTTYSMWISRSANPVHQCWVYGQAAVDSGTACTQRGTGRYPHSFAAIFFRKKWVRRCYVRHFLMSTIYVKINTST